MTRSGDNADDARVARDRTGRFSVGACRDRIADGYYVRNHSFIRHVRTAAAALNPFLHKSRGGRCGEYGEWGMNWIKPCVDRVVPGALVDVLIVEEKFSGHKKQWRDTVDSIYEPWQGRFSVVSIVLAIHATSFPRRGRFLVARKRSRSGATPNREHTPLKIAWRSCHN